VRTEIWGTKSLRRRLLGRTKKSCDDYIKQSLAELKFWKVEGTKISFRNNATSGCIIRQ
jgi:hypothetical protein